MKRKVAYDFNGTADEGYWEKGAIIITGQEKSKNDEIRKLLGNVEIHNFPGGDRTKLGQWKSDKIKELGVTKYVNNDAVENEIIKKNNPSVEVVLVNMKNKLKFVCFTFDGIGFPIFKKLIDEGNDVTVAQIQDVSELGFDDTEKPENKKTRLKNYDGIFNKLDARKVMKALEQIKNKDEYFIFFDFNNLWNYGEKVANMGFNNIFYPTKEQFMMERDRNIGKEFVKKNYTNIKVAEVHEFTDTKEALDFLDDTSDFWVLKSNSDRGETFVPQTYNVEFAKKMVIDKLNEQKKDYESEGFILEKRIPSALEFTPEIMFWNGEPIMTTVDFEYKHIGAGSNGAQVGCGNNLICKTDDEDPINKMAFPQAVYDMARKHKGLFVWDASILYSPIEDEYYFGEFCANRMGWDSFITEMSMSASVTSFFTDIMNGRNPLFFTYGVGVRGFNVEKLSDAMILFDEDIEHEIWLYDMIKSGSVYRTVGGEKDLVVVTGSGFCPMEATHNAYDNMSRFAFNKLQYRPMFDFITDEFSQSIKNRYDAINGSLVDLEDFNYMGEHGE